MINRRNRRGVSLLEFLVIASLMAILVVATMRTLGNARFLRGVARDRGEMLILAQNELDRMRQQPVSEFQQGVQTFTEESSGKSDTVTVSLTKRDDGNWAADVSVERKGPDGVPMVRLSTICQGGEM